MKINASTPKEYINQLPDDRKEVISKIRFVIQQHLPAGFEENLSNGMINYVVPHSIYPAGYHCNPKDPLPFLSIASQKNNIALYHFGMYAVPEMYKWFKENYTFHAKGKPDMAKSCIRFKKMDDVPYELIAQLVQKLTVTDWIKVYETNLKK